jgi:hypothetical protein
MQNTIATTIRARDALRLKVDRLQSEVLIELSADLLKAGFQPADLVTALQRPHLADHVPQPAGNSRGGRKPTLHHKTRAAILRAAVNGEPRVSIGRRLGVSLPTVDRYSSKS